MAVWLSRIGTGFGVQACFFCDECGGKEPVNLIPGCCDFRGGSVAEDFGDRAEQVVANDQVLRCANAQGDVFVSDALHNRGEVRGIRVDQVHGKRYDRGGQGFGLLADGLIRLVEYVEEFRVGLEHIAVKKHGSVVGDFGYNWCGLFDNSF